MKFELTLAKRFVFPERERAEKPTFISAIAAGGVALGVAALILTLSIVQGFSEEIKQKIIGFGSHLHLMKVGGDDFSINRSILPRMMQIPNIESVSPFLQKDVILKSANGTSTIEPALLKGIAPLSDNSFIRKKMIQGEFLRDTMSASFPLVVGKKLAQKLSLRVGDEVLAISTAKSVAQEGFRSNQSASEALKSMRLEPATVVGIYETGLSQGFDDAAVFTTLSAAQNYLQRPEMISGYEITVKNIDRVDETAEALDNAIGFPMYARTIYQIYQNIFVWLRFQENIIPLLLISVSVVAGFNVISTLLIVVLEKGREIGVVMSFGASARQVKTVFIAQSALMSLIGIALGNGIAFFLSIAEKSLHFISISEETYFISNVAISINPMNYLMVSLFTLAVSLLAAWIPAGVAAKLNPVQAIRK